MAIDFTFPPEIDALRLKVREFIAEVVRPARGARSQSARATAASSIQSIIEMRVGGARSGASGCRTCRRSTAAWGSATSRWRRCRPRRRSRAFGPFALNARRPTRATCTRCCTGRTDAQKEKYLRPLCEGMMRSCFAMTEPEVAGSDPTLIQTRAVPRRRRLGRQRPQVVHLGRAAARKFAILIARTEDEPGDPAGRRTRAFIVDLPAEGWNDRARRRDDGRRATTTARSASRTCASRRTNMLGGRGQGHLLGQARLGPARLAHCMRWIGQAEIALDMMVDRALKRFAHGSLLAEKQGIQWMIADSTMELYQCKLMVLHAAYKIDRGEDFRSEVSMAKHFVANALEPHHRPRHPGARRARLLDRHAARAAWRSRRAGRASPTAPTRCTSGASRSARSTPTRRDGSTRAATGDLPL